MRPVLLLILFLGSFAHADSLSSSDINKLTLLKFVKGDYTDTEGNSAKITDCSVNFYPQDKYTFAPSIALEYFSKITPSAGAVGTYFNITEDAPDRDYAKIFYKTMIAKSGYSISILQQLGSSGDEFQIHKVFNVEGTEIGYLITSTWVNVGGSKHGGSIGAATTRCEFSIPKTK